MNVRLGLKGTGSLQKIDEFTVNGINPANPPASTSSSMVMTATTTSTATPTPLASGTSTSTRKRAQARAERGGAKVTLGKKVRSKFLCGEGESYCWTGSGKSHGCYNTTSDVTCEYRPQSSQTMAFSRPPIERLLMILSCSFPLAACGACPYSANAVDCTAIAGVEDVACRSGTCESESY